MSIFSKILGRSQPIEQKDAISLADPAALALFGAPAGASGVPVSEQVAMMNATSGACIRLIATTLASLPVHAFQKDDAGERDRAEHAVERLLSSGFVNPWTSVSDFIQAMSFTALIDGRAYAKVTRVRSEVREVLILPRGSVRREADQSSGEPAYFVRLKSGSEQRLDYDSVIELCPFGGRSPLRDASSAIGLATTLELHGSALFKNFARPGGVLRLKSRLTELAAKRLRESWESAFRSGDTGRVAILEEGSEWQQLQLSSVDSQFLELRQHQVSEICRSFGVPETLVSSLARGTWKNVEELNRQFLQTTVLPWVNAWESALSRALLTPQERASGLFLEMSTAGLERGDTASRFASYQIARAAGIMTGNEVRKLENLPSHPEGDSLASPFTTSGTAPGATAPKENTDDQD